MGRFDQWAAKTKPDDAGPDGEPAQPRKEHPLVERYILDNSVLKSRSKGVVWRRSADINDKDSAARLAVFGDVFTGIVEGGFLRVGRRYLPMKVGDVQVLVPHDYEFGGGNQNDVVEKSEVKVEPADFRCDSRAPAKSKGGLYEVVSDTVALRLFPSTSSAPAARRDKGDVVEMFEWDSTLQWRRFWNHRTKDAGWILLDHPKFGALIRPKDFPFSVRPLEPLCVAAWENNLDDITRFIGMRMDVNVQNPGNMTPLMLAAEKGNADSTVLLLHHQADPSMSSDQTKTALDLASTPVVTTLIQACSMGGDAKEDQFLQAKEALVPEMQDLALRLVERIKEERASKLAERVKEELSIPTWDMPGASEPSAAATVEDPGAGEVPPSPVAADSDEEAEPALTDTPKTSGTYVVIFEKVALRPVPKTSAAACGRFLKDQEVELFDWDESQQWRRTSEKGWVMLDHREFGPLLRPKEMQQTHEPLEPICVAAAENNLKDVRSFIELKHDVNSRVPQGQMTPLMLASEKEHFNCVAVLLLAGADPAMRARKLTAPMRHMIKALSNQDFDVIEYRRARRALLPEVLELVNAAHPLLGGAA